jgi:hypothetical protein
MARSYKHNIAGGNTTCKSEKDDKKNWHGMFRRHCKDEVKKSIEEDRDEHMPKVEEVANVWSFGKDGKRFYGSWVLDMKRFKQQFSMGKIKRFSDRRKAKKQQQKEALHETNVE